MPSITVIPDRPNGYAPLASAKVPPAIIAKLNKAVADALADPAVREKIAQSGAIPAPNSPADMNAMLKREYERWGKIVKEKGIKEGT